MVGDWRGKTLLLVCRYCSRAERRTRWDSVSLFAVLYSTKMWDMSPGLECPGLECWVYHWRPLSGPLALKTWWKCWGKANISSKCSFYGVLSQGVLHFSCDFFFSHKPYPVKAILLQWHISVSFRGVPFKSFICCNAFPSRNPDQMRP